MSATRLAEELRPCPLCDGEAREPERATLARNLWRVRCFECGVTVEGRVGSNPQLGKQHAIAAWNRRTSDALHTAERRERAKVDESSHAWLSIRLDRLAELSAFLEALSEWGCTDPEQWHLAVRAFLVSDVGLTQYLDIGLAEPVGRA